MLKNVFIAQLKHLHPQRFLIIGSVMYYHEWKADNLTHPSHSQILVVRDKREYVTSSCQNQNKIYHIHIKII